MYFYYKLLVPTLSLGIGDSSTHCPNTKKLFFESIFRQKQSLGIPNWPLCGLWASRSVLTLNSTAHPLLRLRLCLCQSNTKAGKQEEGRNRNVQKVNLAPRRAVFKFRSWFRQEEQIHNVKGICLSVDHRNLRRCLSSLQKGVWS